MKMHLVSCYIELGGDARNIVVRDKFAPVPWTEVAILQAMHGEASVHDFKVVDTVDRLTAWNEKQRLISVYGREVVEHVYPGNKPNFEWFMPGEEPDEAEEDTPKTKTRRVPAGVIVE
jgi:hypothetical protein